jgi:ribosomal protein S18 acetylase RimI-like enzyme
MAKGGVTLVHNSHPLYAHRGELASLVVHPDYQRRGIACHLVEMSFYMPVECTSGGDR